LLISGHLRSRSARHAQRFLSAHGPINNLFLLPRHRMPATDCRAERTRAVEAWHDVRGIQLAA
jgi:putative transposase